MTSAGTEKSTKKAYEAMENAKFSVVIPVFNSHEIVGKAIDRTIAFFEEQGLDYEILLVNDHSQDRSWEVLEAKAKANPKHVIAIDLLRNYGQHTANYCGFEYARGDYIITMDDDLQNPPEEILHLIEKAQEGYDLVIGRFRTKQHASYRRWGSRLINYVNRKVFMQHQGLALTNFRLIRREVIDRILAYHTGYPYITGLVLLFSSNPANVDVEHHKRQVGKSNYNILRIAHLISRILFNYSSYPLRFVCVLGIIVSCISFLLGAFYIFKNLFLQVSVPGWTTLVVLLSFFNGISLLIMAMLGEYLIRLIKQISYSRSYDLKQVVDKR